MVDSRDDQIIDLVGVLGIPDNAHVCGPEAYAFFRELLTGPSNQCLEDGLNQSFTHVNKKGRLLHFFLSPRLPGWQVQCPNRMIEEADTIIQRR